MADEEILVLKSIYCLPGETEDTSEKNGAKTISVNIQSGLEKGKFKSQAKIVFHIPSQYPFTAPDISLYSSDIDNETLKLIQAKLCRHADKCTGSSMLMGLTELLQEEILALPFSSEKSKFHETKCCDNSLFRNDHRDKENVGTKDEVVEVSTVILHIDHMRAKTKYIKTIEKWMKKIELTGRLVFCNRLILFILHGEPSQIKEYIARHKTSIVDVDSKGRPCKEKMMSVLCNKCLTIETRFTDFQVVEYSSLDEVKQMFQKFNMQDLFADHVLGLKGLTHS